MHFSSILMMAFAGQVLGDKSPALPQLAAVADAMAPTVSDATVFLRGRDANKKEEAATAAANDALREMKAAAAAAMKGADAAAALDEAANDVSTGPTAAGHIQEYKYEEIEMEGVIRREKMMTLPSGTDSSWAGSTTTTIRTRTSRFSLYSAVRTVESEISTSIETSMKAGASFPIDIVSFSGEFGVKSQGAMKESVMQSATQQISYEKEKTHTFTEVFTKTYTAKKDSKEPDQVVYKETMQIGNKELRVSYFIMDKAEYKSLDKTEKSIVTARVGVDYQYYRISMLKSKSSFGRGWATFFLGVVGYTGTYDEQWALDQRRLISRSGKEIYCFDEKDSTCLIANTGADTNPGLFLLSGTQLKAGAYCLTYRFTVYFSIVVETQECVPGAVTQQWEFIKV